MFIDALLGGTLIGFAALLFSGGVGRVMGVSGILKGILPNTEPKSFWRYMFIIGLIGGVLFYRILFPESIIHITSESYLLYIIAGIFVGLGVSMANGCTSGHAVCGIGRLSVRSIIATITFMLTGILTVYITHHLL
ncbi:YeeE/YedE family protein [Candidatus Gracilibacteria bacterium]|nr:YeeE/YedE family protein [Candidatus Gracilibacteria bacterium]